MPRSILVVDDNKAELSVLCEMLDEKYNVILAESGTKTLSALCQNGNMISAIILNLVLSDIDGLVALKKIRDNTICRQMPIIVVCEYNDYNTTAQALSLGATSFVTKPYNRNIILPLLENIISMREKSALSNTLNSYSLAEQENASELQLSETEITVARLKTLFDDINGGVSVVVYKDDCNVRIVYANERYYSLFGYTKEQYKSELKGPHDTVHPDDWDKAASAIAEVKEKKQAVSFRYRIIKRDKSIAHVRCNSSVAPIDGANGFALISILTDITESVQAEQQAIVYGQRLDAIMKNVNSAVTASIVRSDSTVEFLFLNDLYYEMFCYTKEQYQAEVSDPFQLAHPDDLDTVRNVVFNLHDIGETKELLYRGITRDGKTKWLRVHITIMTFPDADEPVQLSVYSDITDIVDAKEKITAQRDQIADLLNDTPGGIAIIEVDLTDIAGTMRTTYYNDRFITFSGYDRDEYNAMLKKNKMSFVFAEDVPAAINSIQSICSGEVGTFADCTVRCHTKESGFCWLLLTGQLTEKHGNICVINIVMTDITERQEAIDRQRINEEMLRIAAETDRRAIIVYNVKMNTCRVESRTLFSAKYGKVFENIPQSLVDIGVTAPDSVDELCSLFARIKNGENKICVSLQMHSGPDKYEWFECNATTVPDAEGMPDHAVLAFHNITEQRIKEAVFKKWQQSIDARPLESYTLFRINLSRDASLDEQNGNLLKLSIPSEDISFNNRAEYYAQECIHPADRRKYTKLLDLDTLLAMFYRGEHSSSLDYREIDVCGEVSWRRLTVEMVEYPNSSDVQAFLMYEDIDEDKKTEIATLELAKSDPLTGALNRGEFAEKVEDSIYENPNSNSTLLIIDMDGFKQLNDIFGHAAGDQALQEVTAVLHSYTRKGDLVCRLGGDEFLVWMRDIPYDAVIGKTAQQMCEHIRKAYSKELLVTASIGIAVYPRDGQSYDELYHNADKALYKVKQAGKGTYAFFSAINEKETIEVTKALSDVKQISGTAQSKKRRMLIVDDNETNRTMLKNIFMEDYNIEIASNGTEAMIRLRHFGTSVSVILLDLLMPGMDGFEVLKRMQNSVDLRTIPVVVVTGDEEHDTLLKAFELGAAECVTKPVDVDIIRMRVHSVISKAENERLRAQNSYLMLQRDEEAKYRTALESTGTVVIEYDWRNKVYIYDGEVSKYIAGNFDHRGLWQILLSDMVADSSDVKSLQDNLMALANNTEQVKNSKLIKLKTPKGDKHWFRVKFYKSVERFGLTEKMIITFNDVHDEVLANEKLLFQATRDELTGLYNRAGFLEEAAKLIKTKEPGYYVMACIDIEKFQLINDRYGTEVGDKVLKHIAASIGVFEKQTGICCRYMADKFAVMYPARLIGSAELEESHKVASSPDCIAQPLRLRIGRCMVNDTSLSVNAIFDRATMAEALAKGRYDTYIIDFDESMRNKILKEQQIVGSMVDALQNGEFEPWFQPQYNHSTGALIGAEALVRWRKDGKIIPPNYFIPIFERNGFIYEIDRYIWRSVCELLRRQIDDGKNPLPVSVNISRYDLLQKDFMESICSLTEEYKLPVELLRLEVTESAFSKSSEDIYAVVNELIKKGYTVEIDDFGSGYSSLNTLKDVSASILKLDMRFFERTGDAKRGGNIVESVVRMAKWLGMAVIAEGVEDKEQADYLKSIGCIYIQGYFYAKPMPMDEYEKRLASDSKEVQLTHMQTLKHLDNNDFWDSHSMDTLIFNSYVGAACIFELSNGKVDMLRVTDHYVQMLCQNAIGIQDVLAIDWAAHMDSRNFSMLMEAVKESLKTNNAVTWEFEFHDLPGCAELVILRSTLRVIAISGDRYLIYCLNENITAQRIAEREVQRTSERINAVMGHCHSGITAVIARPDRTVELIFVNNRFFEILGYTAEQYATEVKSPYDRVVPEDRERVINTIINLNKVGSSASLELREIRRDGSIVWLRWDASVVKFANISEPVQLANFLDITEQKENELKQLENAHKLEVIMSNVNGGVSALQVLDNTTSKVVFNNDKYYELYGYTKEEAIAENLDVMTLILPEDIPNVMAKIKQMKEDRQPCIIDYRITKKNGSYAMLRANASLMNISGYGDEVIAGVVTDITERKSLEERLSAIIDNINGGVSAVYLKNGKPEYALANEQYYKILGYTKEEFESKTINPFDLLHPDDRERVMKKFSEMQNYGECYTMEYRMIRHDGTVRYILCNTSVIRLFGIEEPLQLAVTNDITQLRETQNNELALNDRLSTVMNAISNGITAVALRGDSMQLLFANNHFYEIHGIRRGNIEEHTLTNLLELALPIYRDTLRKMVNESIKTKKTVSVEYQIQHSSGVIRWVRTTISMTKLTDIDDPVQVAVFSDITEEKEANDQIRFLNESASEILAQPDSEKAINDTLDKLLDYFASDRTYIFELHDETKTSDNTYELCASGITSEMERLQDVPYEIQQNWFDAFENEGFVAISDVAEISGENKNAMRELLLSQNISSIIVAPLWRDDKLIGYIGIDNPTKAIDQVSQLIALTDYIAILLTRRDLTKSIEIGQHMVQQLMDDTPGGFLRLRIMPDSTPVIVSLNIGFCRMLGMTTDEVMAEYGDDAHKCLVAEDIATVKDTAAEALSGNEVYTYKCRLKKKDGTTIWVQVFGRYVKDEHGELFRNSFFTEITEQKSAEQLQIDLLDNLPFGAAMYDYDGNTLTVIHINKSYWELVRRDEIGTVFGALHPDDRMVIRQEIESAIRQKRNPEANCRILGGDGNYLPFHVVGTITPMENGHWKLYLTYSLIDEDEMSIQEMLPIALSTMMSASDNISYVKDKDLHYICCSEALSKLAGLNSSSDVIGKCAYDLFEKKYADKFTADDKKTIETGTSTIGATEKVLDKNGTIRLLSTSKYPVMDANGKVIGVYCISYDITRQRENESQLKLLTSTIPGGIAAYSITKQGIKTLFFNEGYYEYSGYTREEYSEFIKKEPLFLMLSEDRPKMLEMVHKFINDKHDGKTESCTYRCRTKDGVIVWMNLKAVLSEIDEDNFVLNVVQLDVTEQMEAQKKQIELLDNLPCGAGLYRFDGNKLSAISINKRFEEMTGRSLNSGNTELLPAHYIHPDDHKIVSEELMNAIKNRRNAHCDIRLLYGKSEYRTFHLDASILKQSVKMYILYVTYSKIPEQEINFRNALPLIFSTIMESSTDLAFAKDTNYRYMCASKTFTELVGLKSEKEIIGKTDYDLFPIEMADKFRKDDSEIFVSKKPQTDITETIPSPDKKKHYTKTSKYLLKNMTGEVIGIYGIGRDVTEVREAYNQLKLLTDSIPGGIVTFLCKKDSISLYYYNDGLCTLSGYTREEHFEKKLVPTDLVFDEDMHIIKENLDIILSEKRSIECMFRIHTNGGGDKYVNCKAVPVENMGDCLVVNAVITDITAQQKEKEQLRISEEMNRLAVEHGGSILTKLDVRKKTLTLPTTLPAIFELPPVLENMPEEQISLGRISDDTKDIYRKMFEEIYAGTPSGRAVYKQNSSIGFRWLESKYTTLFSNSNEPVSAIITFSDITENLEKEVIYTKWQQTLAEKGEQTYTLYCCNLSQGNVIDSSEGDLLNLKPDKNTYQSFNEMTIDFVNQYICNEYKEEYLAFVNLNTMLTSYYKGIRTASLDFKCKITNEEIRWLRLSVELVEYPASTEIKAYMLFEDINDEKTSELSIIQKATTDPLTGVLNRASFEYEVNRIINNSKSDTMHALLMMDIDGFKLVNDVFGHGIGDKVLVETAELLTNATRKQDLVCRLGGDEFIVFLSDIPSEKIAENKAQQICNLTQKALSAEVHISGSIGIAVFPQDGKRFDELYRIVDKALYYVKENGKNSFSLSYNKPKTSDTPAKTEKKKHRMLIVDDSNIDYEIMNGIFKNEFVIEKASDGATALMKLHHFGNAISVVLLDLCLPGMDGYAVLSKIQQNVETATIPVIVVSSDNARETALKVIKCGASDFVSKPIDAELLRVRVESAVSKAENERLRAQNSFLSIQNKEIASYNAVLEKMGTFVITLDWSDSTFTYGSSVAKHLYGSFDNRGLWEIMLSDMVADSNTVQKMKQLLFGLADDRSKTECSMTVTLKTIAGKMQRFEMNVFKLVNYQGLADKILLVFKENNN